MKKLEAYLKKNNLRLEQVAAALGVGVATVYTWKAGHAKPSIANAIKLEQFTGGMIRVYDWQ